MPDLKVPKAANAALSPRDGSTAGSAAKSTMVPMNVDDGRRVQTSTHSRARKDRPEAVAGRFELDKKLGEGSFGCVFRGTDRQTKQQVAVKTECVDSPDAGQLENEATLLRLLEGAGRPKGFSTVLHFGVEGKWSCLVMELLGLSIEDAMDLCKVMDVGTVCLIVDRAIICLAYLHSKCIVHRDIKCENFMFGVGPKAHHLHLIDFGMSCEFWEGRRHVPMRRGQDLTGTARYASINAMKGYTQGRRDDLEAVGHMLIYLLKGNLPWSGLKARDYRERLQRILYVKRTLAVAELCQDLPGEFAQFLSHARGMRFEKRPDYDAIRGLFRDLRATLKPAVQDHSLMWLREPVAKVKVDVKALEPLDQPTACAPQPEETCTGVADANPAKGKAKPAAAARDTE